MSPLPLLIACLRSRAAAGARDRNGSTAVEFAMLVPIFLGLVFSLMEVGWFYFVNAQLDGATLRAARMIRTGAVQQQNFDKDDFYNEVCPSLTTFGQDCNEFLTVEVKTYASYAALAGDNAAATCADASNAQKSTIPYEPGVDHSIVRIRLCLMYKTMNPALGVNLSENAGGKRRLYGSYLFRNEPYSRSSGNNQSGAQP